MPNNKTFKSDFIGTGNMERFCAESNRLFAAISNIQFIMPSGYSGVEPTAQFEDGRIVFDFGEALIFTTNNIVWNFSGSASVTGYNAAVQNGKLHINVNAESAD